MLATIKNKSMLLLSGSIGVWPDDFMRNGDQKKELSASKVEVLRLYKNRRSVIKSDILGSEAAVWSDCLNILKEKK